MFSLPEGEVVLEWPEPLSPESYEDFESWINLVLRRVKRSVREPTKEQGNPPTERSAHSERATASVSLMITQEQKSALRERGYDDEQGDAKKKLSRSSSSHIPPRPCRSAALSSRC